MERNELRERKQAMHIFDELSGRRQFCFSNEDEKNNLTILCRTGGELRVGEADGFMFCPFCGGILLQLVEKNKCLWYAGFYRAHRVNLKSEDDPAGDVVRVFHPFVRISGKEGDVRISVTEDPSCTEMTPERFSEYDSCLSFSTAESAADYVYLNVHSILLPLVDRYREENDERH